VVAKPDGRDNVYPRKDTPMSKIDGAIAALMAVGRAMTTDGGPDSPEIHLW
jgi:phage terminase large subunit-like protein